LQEWRQVWQRELIESPPADGFISAYFGYEAPVIGGEESSDEGEVEFDLSECER
jgi:hypothetical protein